MKLNYRTRTEKLARVIVGQLHSRGIESATYAIYGIGGGIEAGAVVSWEESIQPGFEFEPGDSSVGLSDQWTAYCRIGGERITIEVCDWTSPAFWPAWIGNSGERPLSAVLLDCVTEESANQIMEKLLNVWEEVKDEV